MATNRYMKRPVYIEAMQVTKQNANKVAEWCGGSVSSGPEVGTYVNVPHVHASRNRAYVTDYVTRSANNVLSVAKMEDFERVYIKA